MTSADVKLRARELGFDLCGIAPPDVAVDAERFRSWLDRGYAGEMRYLERSATRRQDARLVLPSVRSVVALGVRYDVDRPYSTEQTAPGAAALSRYAWGEDYHA